MIQRRIKHNPSKTAMQESNKATSGQIITIRLSTDDIEANMTGNKAKMG